MARSDQNRQEGGIIRALATATAIVGGVAAAVGMINLGAAAHVPVVINGLAAGFTGVLAGGIAYVAGGATYESLGSAAGAMVRRFGGNEKHAHEDENKTGPGGPKNVLRNVPRNSEGFNQKSQKKGKERKPGGPENVSRPGSFSL